MYCAESTIFYFLSIEEEGLILCSICFCCHIIIYQAYLFQQLLSNKRELSRNSGARPHQTMTYSPAAERKQIKDPTNKHQRVPKDPNQRC